MAYKYVEPKESEKEYRELAKLGLELGIPIPECFLEMEVTLHGKTLVHTKQRSHSWVRNAYNILFGQLTGKNTDNTFGAGHVSFKATNGDMTFNNYSFVVGAISNYAPGSMESFDVAYRADTGNITSGIVVGSDNTPESFESFCLGATIGEGSGAGRLSYSAHLPNVRNYDAGTKTMSVAVARFMNNNSGNNITVREVAQIANILNYKYRKPFLVSRDLVTPEILIPNAGQLRVTYTYALTFPA